MVNNINTQIDINHPNDKKGNFTNEEDCFKVGEI